MSISSKKPVKDAQKLSGISQATFKMKGKAI
jgi:hypothetical protein